jgi:hypothetical protein
LSKGVNFLFTGHSIDAFCHVSVNLAKRFQRRRFFKNWPIRNKNGLWWPCLLTDRYEMSYRSFHRCFLPSFGSFGLTVSEEKILKNRPFKMYLCVRCINFFLFLRIFLIYFGTVPQCGIFSSLCQRQCELLFYHSWLHDTVISYSTIRDYMILLFLILPFVIIWYCYFSFYHSLLHDTVIPYSTIWNGKIENNSIM